MPKAAPKAVAAKTVSKVGSQENFFAYVAAAVVIGLVSIFVLSWSHLKTSGKLASEVSYTRFGPYRIDTQNYSLTASLAVQTSGDDAGWAEHNREALNVIFKQVLAGSDPKSIKAPNRLQILQDALMKACSNAFGPKIVQSVFMTDFTFEINSG